MSHELFLVSWFDVHLSERLQVRSVPVRKDDEVMVVRGTFKGREGKVAQVYRRNWVNHVECITRENVNRNPLFETM